MILLLASCEGEPPECGLPIEIGPCKALVPSWAFDSELRQCVHFDHGGCEGNGNRFDTLAECEATCAPLSSVGVRAGG